MKKIILLMIILASVVLSGNIYANEIGTLTVSEVTGAVGDEVEITVSISNNPGIATFSLNLNFDKTKLTPVSIAKGTALTVGDITSNMQAGGDLNTLDFVTAFWVNPSNITSNGTLYSVKFKIKEGVTENIPITLSYGTGGVANQSFDYVTLQIINGNVIINDSNAPTVAISATKPNDNKEVDVAISFTDNPGIATFSLRLNFDKTKLTPISIVKGEALTVGDITSNIQAGGDLSILDFVTAFWVNPSNITSNGTLYTVKFKVKEGALGVTSFDITYNPSDIANQSFDIINLNIIGTTIALSGQEQELETSITDNSLAKEGNTVIGNLEINIANNSEDEKFSTVRLAVYDANGVLVYVSSKNNLQLSVGDNRISYSGINIVNALSEKYKFKIFVWEATGSLEPLVDLVEENLI